MPERLEHGPEDPLQERRVAGEELEERLAVEPEGEARGLGAGVPFALPSPV